MILKKVQLENFRGYENAMFELDENLSVIVGTNDIGKSTLLEALDIFFGGEVIKPEQEDLNIISKKRGETTFKISCQFDITNKNSILIDTTNKTEFKDEFLLNKEGLLEIVQEFDATKNKITPKIFLKINYPKELSENLNILKLKDLKEKVKELNIADSIEDGTKKSSYRKAIYSNLSNKNDLEEKYLLIDKSFDDYNLWDKIKLELPLYFLFQSDRSNTDKDSEIQNPLKIATKRAVADLQDKIEAIKEEIKNKVEKIGEETIKELKTFNLEIADTLSVNLSMKNFDSLFSFDIMDEEGIALNKRGSGVRRVMLLSYFMAEVKSKTEEKKVIYAIEEPETSQHPLFQNKILEAFKELSKEKCQIILTTHSPAIVKQMRGESLIFIKREENQRLVLNNESINILDVARTLGISPNINSKLIISVEGETDVEFFKTLNKIPEIKDIIDLDRENIGFIPQKGGKILEWINRNYLSESLVYEIIICDSDNEVYVNKINELNNQNDSRRKGIILEKFEIENYISPVLYNSKYNTNYKYDEAWNGFDIPKNLVTELENEPRFKSCNGKKDKIEKQIKIEISTQLFPKITKSDLEHIGCFEEVKEWFTQIKELYDSNSL